MPARYRVTLILILLLATPVLAQPDPIQEIERLRLSGEREQACKMLEPLVHTSHQNDPVALLYYAYCLRDHNRPDEARKMLKRVMELSNAWPGQAAHSALADME